MKYQSFCVKLKSSRLSHLGTILSDGQIKRSWILDGQVSIRAANESTVHMPSKKLGEWTFESFFFLAIFSGIKEYLKKIVESELSEPNKIQQQFPENKRYYDSHLSQSE